MGARGTVSKKVTTNDAQGEKKPRITYSDELLEVILDRVAAGESLAKVCDAPDMPTRKSFYAWVADVRGVKEKYEMALSLRSDVMAEELLAIADAPVGTTDSGATDSGMVQKQKLQVDTRKWLLSKMAPKKYGEKIEQTIQSSEGGPVKIELVSLK